MTNLRSPPPGSSLQLLTHWRDVIVLSLFCCSYHRKCSDKISLSNQRDFVPSHLVHPNDVVLPQIQTSSNSHTSFVEVSNFVTLIHLTISRKLLYVNPLLSTFIILSRSVWNSLKDTPPAVLEITTTGFKPHSNISEIRGVIMWC